jgi:DNA repair protein RecN (Recombination protein N)
MIHELRIRGLGVIDEAVIPFAPGLTVLTGETGAGKTMVLTGLGLIRGDKADAGLVRTGSDHADVDAEWRLPATAGHGWARAVLDRLEEAGGSCEAEGPDLVLLLGRSVAAGGRSRAFAGGRSVPASTLAELGESLMAVHGQADQLLIRDPRRQRELLDLFAGRDMLALKTQYAADFARWRTAARELRDLIEHRQEREREAALLRHGIDEIAAVEPVPGEDEALKAQASVLAHATDLLAEVGSAHADLMGGDDAAEGSVTDLLTRARRSIERARALDESLASTVEHLDRIIESVSVAAGELAAYARDVDADPARQAEVEERRQAISALKRRYGPELDDVLAWWAAAQESVSAVDGADARGAELAAEVDALRARVVSGAEALTAQRRAAGDRLGAAVTAELHDLAMPDAAVTVAIDTTDDPESFTAEGADTVSMLLTPHSGSEARPLGKGASGGELSRIMLAIEVVLAGVDSVPSFVFDEVDAGIGGRVAVEVGRRLARLARTSQVIVVTHLPQVAAFADQHVVVAKDGSGQVTASSVAVVDGPERVRELVRMLSGLEDSQSGAEHAAELLALAEEDRGNADVPKGASRRRVRR